MNLELIASNLVSQVNPRQNIEIYAYLGQTVDNSGNVIATYDDPISITAQVQPTERQALIHIQNANYTAIYKNFWIQNDVLSGLNRNLSTGGDFIKMNDLFYKIVALPENFKSGWIWVIGCESTLMTG